MGRMDPREPAEQGPKYLRLAKGFERLMRAGVLRVGDRLPSVRQLRRDHGISVATAVGCYLWLERQGYVRAQPRSGYYVSRRLAPESAALAPPAEVETPKARLTAHWSSPGPEFAMGPAVLGPEFLPGTRLNRSIRMALSAFADHAMVAQEPQGNLRLRRQIGRVLFRQGVHAPPHEIVVTNGATEAFSLALRGVAGAGDTIAVESPVCYDVLRVLDTLEMNAVEVPELAASLGELKAAVERHRPRARVLTANCHNPVHVADGAKDELVRWAAALELPLVEGDYFGELVFQGDRRRTLKSFDRGGLVLSCGSLAHYVAPGLNVGWLLPGRWLSRVQAIRSASMAGVAALPQLAMAEFLESGAFDKHLRHLRTSLGAEVERVRDEILRLFPAGTRVSRPEAGFVLWVTLPAGLDGREVAARALDVGVQVLPGSLFSPTERYRDCLRLSCVRPFEVLRPAIRTLAGLVRDLQRREGKAMAYDRA